MNAILEGLPSSELDVLKKHLVRTRLVAHQVLCQAGEIVDKAYFLEDAVVSIRDTTQISSPIQVALLDRYYLVGSEALLFSEQPCYSSAIVQRAGSALSIPMRDLAVVTEQCPALKVSCMASISALMRQITTTAASNARDSLAQRCIRLLLKMHDAIEGQDVEITHEALSEMLGVRRSGVTQVTSSLRTEGLIGVGRGRIKILDRPGMERQMPQGRAMLPALKQVYAGRAAAA